MTGLIQRQARGDNKRFLETHIQANKDLIAFCFGN